MNAISFFALAVFALLALVVVGGLVALVANPKTRVLGLVLLLAPVPLVVLGAAVLFGVRGSYVANQQSAIVAQQSSIDAAMRARQVPPTRALEPTAVPAPPFSSTSPSFVPTPFLPPGASTPTPPEQAVLDGTEAPRAAQPDELPGEHEPPVPAPEEKPEVDPGVIRALGRALTLAIEKPKPATKLRTASRTAKPAAAVPPPAPEAAPPVTKPAPADPPAAQSGDPKIEAMVRSLAGAVVEELPADMDELTALRALGHYLGRAIAAEREAMASGDTPATDSPQASEHDRVHEHETIAEDPPRPAWVDMPQGRQGDNYQVVVSVGPYSSRLECDRAVPNALYNAAAEYATYYLGHPTHGRDVLPYEYLREQVLRDEWEEPVNSQMVGPMVRLHLQLVFDRQANEAIKEGWREAEIQQRIAISGICLAAVLGVLGAAFALLKVDAATHGAYRRAAAVLAGVVALVVVLGFLWLDRGTPQATPKPPGINTYPTSMDGGYSYDVPMIVQQGPTASSAQADAPLAILPVVILPLGLLTGGLLAWRFRTHRKWVIVIAAGTLAVVFLVAAKLS